MSGKIRIMKINKNSKGKKKKRKITAKIDIISIFAVTVHPQPIHTYSFF